MVYIVLVNYNSSDDTIDCVNSIEQSNYRDYRIIIVDNCSDDKEKEKLKLISSKPTVDLICSNKNSGWASACNIGMKKAVDDNVEYVMLLNNDTLVDSDFIQSFMDNIEKFPKLGMVSSKIIYESQRNRIWSAGGYYDKFRCTGIMGKYKQIDHEPKGLIEEATFLTGCSVLIPVEAIRQVGYFDESYFMYADDLEYSRRFLKFGYKLYYFSDSIIYHKVSAASGGEYSPFYCEWCTRSNLKYIREHGEKKVIAYILFAVFFVAKIGYFLLHGKFKQIRSLFKGLRRK